jgi:hypothetical protein
MLTGRPHVPGKADQLPPSLDAIVRRATARDPAERFVDASGFRDALESFDHVDHDRETAVIPVSAKTVPPSERGNTTRRASPWLSPVDRAAAVFFAGVALVMLVAMVSLGIGVAGSPNPQTAVSPAPSLASTPELQDVAVTAPPGDEDRGNGHGNGGGNGKGKDKDDD